MLRKGLAVAVILLFIGVAFAPSINAVDAPVPDLDCEGDLVAYDVEPGETLTGTLGVENIGEPLSELNWEIVDWPDWGTWTFCPLGMPNLMPEDGAVTVTVEVVLPDEIDDDLWGEILIVNLENSSDICTLDVFFRKKSIDEELVEFDVEFCGLGKKHTVQLTQQEADEIELLFADIEQRLAKVETREEAEEIFKEAVVELDKYGLLGSLSVKQAQRLVTRKYTRIQE